MLDKSRMRRAVLLSLALVSCASLVAMAAVPAAGDPSPWPANTKVVEARLARVPQGSLDLPQLRIYDAQGRRVFSQVGYDARTFTPFFTRALKGGGLVDERFALSSELPLFQSLDGKVLAMTPAADYTIVEYWAPWCGYCRAQAQAMAQILAANPDVRVTLLHVDANYRDRQD